MNAPPGAVKRVKIFIAANSLAPAYGGPAYSVSRLATALSGTGLEVGLWAADGSALNTPLLRADAGVKCMPGTAAEALQAFGRPDVLHDNGIWMGHHHELARIAVRRGIPRIVSTRGMLTAWALKHKTFKKHIAWWLYQRWDLCSAVRHHVTADSEAQAVQRLELAVPVTMIPNGVDIPDTPANCSPAGAACEGREKTALFLGRVYPVKGLPILIDAWAHVRPRGWRLHIAGPDEAGHRAVVQRRVSDAGLADVVSFLGPLYGEAKRAALLGADLFVLPTYSENFGMAIGEALAHGLPVLTTTGAPWPQLMTRSCGWRVAPTREDLALGLRHATSLDRQTMRAMGARGRQLVAAEFSWASVAEKFSALYRAATCDA
jgi:glycosyltransferase involved in cell wall biosynthesis